MKPENIQIQEEEDIFEINLADIIRFLKDGKKAIFIGVALFILLGIIVALSTPNEFTAEGKILPELQSKGVGGSLGGLKSLAGLAGIDLGSVNSTEAIRPDLYPNIIQSMPFKMYILDQTFLDSKSGKKYVLKDYFIKQGESSWGLGKLIEKIFGKKVVTTPKPEATDQVISITKTQEDLIKNVGERIGVNMDKKTGVISVSVKMPDPVMSASVTAKSIEYLTNYVINYRTEKAKADLAFYVQRVAEIKKRKEDLEYAFYHYSDVNRNPFFKTVEIPQKKLQAEYELMKSLYDELNKQMEQAKIKLREETPVFKMLEPPVVPLKKSEPKRSFMVIGFAMLGMIAGVLFLLWKRFNPYTYLKNV